MARLAEYMAELARLLGFQEHVHFKRVVEGSLELVQTIEPSVYPLVRGRLESIHTNYVMDDGVHEAFDALNAKLQKDNARAKLFAAENEVIEFLGRDRPQPIIFGPFSEEGTLQGQLVLGVKTLLNT
jgi:hypothetical protein